MTSEDTLRRLESLERDYLDLWEWVVALRTALDENGITVKPLHNAAAHESQNKLGFV